MIVRFCGLAAAGILLFLGCKKTVDKADSTFESKKTMTTNLPVKHTPEEFFKGDSLEIASAIEGNDIEKLQRLLKSQTAKLNDAGKDGMTLLFWAASLGQIECVKALLDAGANPNSLIQMGGQSFQLLALAAGGKSDALFELLLDSGANPNCLDNSDPAIFAAIHARRWDRMKKLLDHGADINLAGKDKSPPVVYLASINQYEQVAELISRGADITKPEFGGGTLSDYVGRYSLDTTSPNGRWHAKVQQMLAAKGIRTTTPKQRK